MIGTNLIRFSKESGFGTITTNGTLNESVGPAGREGYCLLRGNYCTTPYKKQFKKASKGNNMILLEGNTKDYTVPFYGDNMDSLDQYFLEHKVRDDNKLQCLIYVSDEQNNPPYIAFCPGLITSITGEVLGYLHSHVADQNGKVVFEIPDNTTKTYSFDKTAVKSGNKYTFTNVTGTVTINDGEGSFNLYATPNGTVTLKVKNVCDYFDYILAACITNNVESALTYITDGDTFKSFPLMSLELFADAIKDVTPSIYKVPAAFVPVSPNSIDRKLMVNVAGMSAIQFYDKFN